MVAGAGLTAGVVFATAAGAEAADFTVSTLADDGPGSLRAATEAANAAASDDRILFQSGLSGDIKLTTGQITISDGVEVIGPGAVSLAVDGNDSSKIFRVDVAAPGEPVSISGLTLKRGNSNSDPDKRGGAILSTTASLTLSGVVLSDNFSVGAGGAICACGDDRGDGARLTLRNTTISGNEAFGPNGAGGGIYSDYATLRIEGSTISSNLSEANGGGLSIYNPDGPSLISNSTVSGNTGLAHLGGGIYSYSGDSDQPLNIASSTLAGNVADRGGGIFVKQAPPAELPRGRVILGNVIVGDNIASSPNPSSGHDINGTVSASFSLVESPFGAGFTVPAVGLITGEDPQLAPLAGNGGPTRTRAIARTSPAVDAGLAAGVATDQRGFPRPAQIPAEPDATSGDAADIGAFEFQVPPVGTCQGRKATLVLPLPGSPIVGTSRSEVIIGTSRADVIRPGGGRDLVCGRGGADRIAAGAGNDTLLGGSGRDTLKGANGRDRLFGNASADKLFGGPGSDFLRGGPGRDVIRGGPGRDNERQ